MEATKQTTVRAAVIPAPDKPVEVRAFPRPDLDQANEALEAVRSGDAIKAVIQPARRRP